MKRIKLFEKHSKGSYYAQGYVESAKKPRSLRSAINAKCIFCTDFKDCWDKIANCNIETCPLWPFRPYLNQTLDGL